LEVHPFTAMPDFATHIIDQLLQKAVKVLFVRVLALVVGLLILFPQSIVVNLIAGSKIGFGVGK
jgi:hypothetical protein